MRTSTLIITPFKKIIAVTQWATALSMTLVSPQIFAVVLDNQTLTITSLDAPTDYQLVNQSLLIVDSAQTFGLRLNRSGLNILSGTVTATGRGIELADSQATIANASITSSSNFGLLLVHGSGVGSTATVTNSQITGATTGAQATAGAVC
ncbi:hypothetical protein NWF32_12890 [Pseudomonas qingdaonensis]|nr:hypothetical protein [Pseudomonas qingdaonensis]